MDNFLQDISKADMVNFLVENTPVAYIILDKDYRIHYINDFFLKLRNFDKQEVLGEKCYNLSNGGKHCGNCAVENAMISKTVQYIARKDTLPNGMVRFIDDYAIPLFKDKGGNSDFILEIMINRTQEMLEREKQEESFRSIFEMMATLLEAKDKYTSEHSKRVGEISMKIAEAMGLEEREIFDISIAASLHDIGKVKISYAIINKPAKLDDDEFNQIKAHPENSYKMIETLSGFEVVKHIVRYHHERFDGRGYPFGLKGEALDIGAKIIAVADTYDAMTSTRSYRKALSHEIAVDEIVKNSGSQFDPAVVEVFLSIKGFDEKHDLNVEAYEKKAVISRSVHKRQDNPIPSGEYKNINTIIAPEVMLEEIFNNVPVGYVIMDHDLRVCFANEYFFNYMGLKPDAVIGNICHEIVGNSGRCTVCPVIKTMQSGKMEHCLAEQPTPNGLRFFDIFALNFPNKTGSKDYVVEIIIDRTQEMLAYRARQNDFKAILNMLSNLLHEKLDDDERFSNQVIALQNKCKELMDYQEVLAGK